MALIQAVGFVNEQTSATINVPIANTGAGGPSGLILLISNYIDTKQPTSFVAGNSNVTVANVTANNTSDNYFHSIWSIKNVASGINTATIHMSASGFVCGFVIEESGLGDFDQGSNNRSVGSTTWTSNNITTTSALEVAYTMAFTPGVNVAFVAGNNWTQLSGNNITNGTVQETTNGLLDIYGMRQALSSIGTYQGNGTGPNDTYVTLIASFISLPTAFSGFKMYANGTFQSLNMVELAGSNNKMYANGTIVSSQFIE